MSRSPKHITYVAILASVVFTWASARQLGAADQYKTTVRALTETDFKTYVEDSKKPVLVDFWAPWCHACRKYSPIIDQLAQNYAGKLKVARVDINENPVLAKYYRVRYIPTSFLFVNGQVVDGWVGGLPASDLKKKVDNLLNKKKEHSMNKTIRLFLYPTILTACLIAGSCSKSRNQAGDSDVLAVTDSSFNKEVMDSDTPVLVDFWATWCGPCRLFGPIVDQLATEYKGRLKVVRVDVDQNPRLSREYKIRAIPSSFLIQKGSVLKTWVGLVPEYEIKQELDKDLPPVAKATPSHP